MNVEVVKVPLEEKQILTNLVKMYCYEWSQYNKYDVNDKGDYEFEYQLSSFWKKEKHYPFFIKVDGILAGFVLIDDDFKLYQNSDYAISEFFVMYKYRRTGVGRKAAKIMFDMFRGKWEIVRHPYNGNSIRFWNSVVEEYTNGKYEIINDCSDAVYPDGICADIVSFENYLSK